MGGYRPMNGHLNDIALRSHSVGKRILIVGGGLGGLMLATRLGHTFKNNNSAHVFLVDRAPVHVWKPILHTFAAGSANAHEDGVPFVAQAKQSGFTYLPGALDSINRDKKTVTIKIDDLDDKSPIQTDVEYDVLVIATGSSANDFGVAGVQEHCYFIDNLWRAEQLNKALRTEIIFRSVSGGDIRIAIVGGGATGVEFAAEVARLIDVGAAYGAVDLPKRLKVMLLDAGKRILSAFPEEISNNVSDDLKELGVEIINQARITGVDTSGFLFEDGERCDAGIKVWAAGVKAVTGFTAGAGLEQNRAGQLVVNERLQTTKDGSIFAFGDCASFTPSGSEKSLPPTGQVARQQADYLARALPRIINGSAPKSFLYKEMGTLVSLSQYGAYGTLGQQGVLPSISLKGWTAKRAHDAFYRLHQLGLFGLWRTGVLLLRDGLNGFVKPPVRFD
ncbi:MAG: NAD(P)/FAD-dependent oxidoreductase [Pseudomonadota bacterium]